jgi:hypothetical protein
MKKERDVSNPGSAERPRGIEHPQGARVMRYLCLVYFEPGRLAALSRGDDAKLTNESIAYDEELERAGTYITSQALKSVEEAKTVRVRNGAMSTTDGPFAETK